MGGNIYIEIPNRDSLEISLTSKVTLIKTIKSLINEKTQIPSDQINLFYNGQLLEDNKTIYDYYIDWNETLELKYIETEPEIITSTQLSDLKEESEAISFSNTEENEVISSSSLIEEKESQTREQTGTQMETQTESQTGTETGTQTKITSTFPQKSSYIYINTSDEMENILEETLVTLFGFSNYKLEGNEIAFYIYFIAMKNFLFSKKMNFRVIINSDSNLRFLQNTLSFCDKVTNNNIKVKYLCKFKITNPNIKRVGCLKDFSFIQKRVNVISLTPLARRYINDLQKIEDTDLFAYNIYILKNAINNKYDINLFNISGTIQDEKPNFGFIDLVLIINSLKENKTEEEANCTITEIDGINYTLSCGTEENIDCDLQSSISFINNNDILLINFDNNTNTSLVTENKENIKTRNFMAKSGLSNTSMFLIIFFSLLFPIIIVIAFLFIIKKKYNQKQISSRNKDSESMNNSLNKIKSSI